MGFLWIVANAHVCGAVGSMELTKTKTLTEMTEVTENNNKTIFDSDFFGRCLV